MPTFTLAIPAQPNTYLLTLTHRTRTLESPETIASLFLETLQARFDEDDEENRAALCECCAVLADGDASCLETHDRHTVTIASLYCWFHRLDLHRAWIQGELVYALAQEKLTIKSLTCLRRAPAPLHAEHTSLTGTTNFFLEEVPAEARAWAREYKH